VLEKPQKGEWTCPGAHHLEIRLRVGREPRGDGVPIDSPKTVTSLLFGLGRLSSRTFWGAGRRQGQRNSSRDPHRLDPDGWLVRYQTDTKFIESPAAKKGRQMNSIRTKHHRVASTPRSGSRCPLDTRLLMGGTLHTEARHNDPLDQPDTNGFDARSRPMVVSGP
jgi:hypothetical protein